MTRRRHGPRELDRAAGTPLWQQLRDDLVARLEGGEFPDRFPGELELVEIYAVSRHTVREALRHLRQQGLIESSRGRSSVANPGLIHQQLGTIYSLFHVLESRGLRQTSELLVADSRVGPEAAVRLGLPEDSTLVYLERVRYGDDEPIAWDRAWLDPELGAPMLDADLSHTALYDEWARTAGVRLTGGREEIRAVIPSPEERERLQMADDEAAMLVERTGVLDGRAVEFRVTVIRGSKFSFIAEWTPGKPYSVDVSG